MILTFLFSYYWQMFNESKKVSVYCLLSTKSVGHNNANQYTKKYVAILSFAVSLNPFSNLNLFFP